MKHKTVVTIALLLFVAVSIVALVSQQSNRKAPDASETAVNDSSAAAGDGRSVDSGLPEDRLIVYYFHGNARCPTCLTLEAYSKEAVETGFPNELTGGRVEWQVVNFDEPWNEHFLTDFNIGFQSLVLVEIKDGRQVDYKNLEKIWDLVGNKPAYLKYVQDEITTVLEGR